MGSLSIILKKVEETQKEILYRLLQYSLFEESLNDQNDMNEDALSERRQQSCALKNIREPGRFLHPVEVSRHIYSGKM